MVRRCVLSVSVFLTLGILDTTSYVTPVWVSQSDRDIRFLILSVRLCRLNMFKLRRFLSTKSMGAGCDRRTVVFKIIYTRSLPGSVTEIVN